MIKTIILSLCALSGVTRATVNRTVDWTSYQYGYSFVSDLLSDSEHRSFSINFTVGTLNKFRNASVSYIYGDYSDLNTKTVDRVYNGHNSSGSVKNLLSLCYGTDNLSSLAYTFDTTNMTYSYSGSNFANQQQFVVYYDTDNDYLCIDSNYTSLYVTVTYSYFYQDRYDYEFYTSYLNMRDTENDYYHYSLALDSGYDFGCISVDITNNAEQEQYNEGYQTGYQEGSQNGYQEGLDTGYQSGRNDGIIEGQNMGNNFINLLFAVMDTPIYYLKSLFSVSVFGTKVYAVVLSMVTCMVLLWVIKRFVL